MHVTKIERSDSSAVQCCTGVDKVAVIVALFWVHYNIPTYFLLTFLLTYIEVTVECHGASTYNVRDTSHVLGRFFVVLHLDAHLVLVPVICVADQVVVLVLIERRAADRRLCPDVAGQAAAGTADDRHRVLPARTARARRLPAVT